MFYGTIALLLLGQVGTGTGPGAATGQPTSQAPTPQHAAQPYQPAVPSPSIGVYGGYGGYGGRSGGTVAGSAMSGLGDAINAKGNYNLSTSAAAVNMTQARANQIQNRQAWTNTYFQMQQENRAYREEERGPRPSAEELARIAHQGAPKPLSPSEVNHVTGQINWPGPLQDDSFAAERTEVERYVEEKAKYGKLSYADQMAVKKVLNTMAQQLKDQIQSIPPQDYVACKTFLNSLMYATTQTAIS